MVEYVSTTVLRSSSLLLLEDFEIHAELTGTDLEFMKAMAGMGLYQHTMGPMNVAGHSFELEFTSGQA